MRGGGGGGRRLPAHLRVIGVSRLEGIGSLIQVIRLDCPQRGESLAARAISQWDSPAMARDVRGQPMRIALVIATGFLRQCRYTAPLLSLCYIFGNFLRRCVTNPSSTDLP